MVAPRPRWDICEARHVPSGLGCIIVLAWDFKPQTVLLEAANPPHAPDVVWAKLGALAESTALASDRLF